MAWRSEVAKAAMLKWPVGSSASAISLQLQIFFYYRGNPLGDLDNFVKPIQDALIGIVYVDDSQITDIICRRRAVETQYRIEDVPLVLLDGLTLYDDFLYLKIESAPDLLLLNL